MSDRHGIAQGVAILVRRENPETSRKELLLMLRAQDLSYMGGYWSLVVGHREPLESPSQAMARELNEEAGLTVVPEKLAPLLTIHTAPEEGEGPEGERTDTYFEVSVAELSGEPQNKEPERCDEIRWFAEDALPENLMPRQRQALGYIAAGKTYVETGWQ